jgi:hypothetical protein
MSAFKGIEEKFSSQGGVYPEAGIYKLLNVSILKQFKDRKADECFVAEFEILDSDVDDRPAGSTMSWMANLSKHDAALGNVRGLLAALTGSDESTIDEDACLEMVGEEQPGRNRLIKLEAINIITQKGNPFTKCKWIAVPDDVQAKCSELRESAGFA